MHIFYIIGKKKNKMLQNGIFIFIIHIFITYMFFIRTSQFI